MVLLPAFIIKTTVSFIIEPSFFPFLTMAANVILNSGAIVASLIPLAFIVKPTDPSKQTSIAIGVGSGGSVPHVAIWDEDGNRITQYKGEANGHICKGDTFQTTVDNYQNGMKPADPTYVSVVMKEIDAICVAVVSVSGNGQQWTWTGDMAYTCGAQWMESDYTFQGSNVPIRCAWLDADYTNGAIANGMTMHIRDFTADAGLVWQYKNNTERLCKNSKRLTFWPDIQPDSQIAVFSPPMKYTRNINADNPDPTAPDMSGSLTEPDVGIDRKNRAYPDGTDLKGWKTGSKKRHAKDLKSRRGIKQALSETIVISHFPSHSAREMCEDPMALSSDFVSVQEGLFCDMTLRKLWPVCTPTVKTECFDIPSLSLHVKGPQKRNDVSNKQYTKQHEWGLTHEKRALLPPMKPANNEKRSLFSRKKHPGDKCNPKE
jgi:hypothetical protein